MKVFYNYIVTNLVLFIPQYILLFGVFQAEWMINESIFAQSELIWFPYFDVHVQICIHYICITLNIFPTPTLQYPPFYYYLELLPVPKVYFFN